MTQPQTFQLLPTSAKFVSRKTLRFLHQSFSNSQLVTCLPVELSFLKPSVCMVHNIERAENDFGCVAHDCSPPFCCPSWWCTLEKGIVSIRVMMLKYFGRALLKILALNKYQIPEILQDLYLQTMILAKAVAKDAALSTSLQGTSQH